MRINADDHDAIQALMAQLPEKLMRTVAELMREWRRVAGLSTSAAGERLGLSSRAIEDIEQGRRRAGDELTKIALKHLIQAAK